MFESKDFVSTRDGLLFAVVSNQLDADKILCFLRYIQQDGQWKKVNTDVANAHLTQYFPHLLHYSSQLDAHLHALPVDLVYRHYQPRQRLAQIMNSNMHSMGAEFDCFQVCTLLQEQGLELDQIGVTGSLLPEVQNDLSDIDLVCYSRDSFFQLQSALSLMLHRGSIMPLSDTDWVLSYQRRQCELSISEYVWHEKRKMNKVMFNQRKIDFSLAQLDAPNSDDIFVKQGEGKIQAKIIDDSLAFDSPAYYHLDHATVSSIVCFTPTYCGQAFNGEIIEAAGQLEKSSHGQLRLLIGSTREAKGEYIKVIEHGG